MLSTGHVFQELRQCLPARLSHGPERIMRGEQVTRFVIIQVEHETGPRLRRVERLAQMPVDDAQTTRRGLLIDEQR